MRQQCVLQGVFAVARARVHHQPRRLVDHDDRGVLVDYVQRQFLRQPRRSRRAGAPRPWRSRHPPRSRGARGVRPLTRTAPSSIQRWIRVREYCGRSCGQCLIQPPAGKFRGQREMVGLELGGQPCGPRGFRGRYTSRVRRPFQTQSNKFRTTGIARETASPSMRALRSACPRALLFMSLVPVVAGPGPCRLQDPGRRAEGR